MAKQATTTAKRTRKTRKTRKARKSAPGFSASFIQEISRHSARDIRALTKALRL